MCALCFPVASPCFPALPLFLPAHLPEQANNHSDNSRSNGDIIRVTDPAAADVFFVPFLASLSFNIFTTNGMRGALAEKDKILQEELWSVLKVSPWWQRSGGRDHIIPMLQPNALRHIRQRLAPAMFLLLDFGRYAQGVARLSKDIVVPYNHIAPPYTEPPSYGEAQGPWEARTTLLFFQGTIMRKDEGYIRKLIFDMYHKEPDVRFVESKITGPQDIISAAEGLRNSRFCLNAAGDTPSSARLFDAITSHCVPVVISNKIELPFETSIDYSDFTLFVSHEDALRQGYLLRLLRTFPRERWLQMWQTLQQVKHHFEFQAGIPLSGGRVCSFPRERWLRMWQNLQHVKHHLEFQVGFLVEAILCVLEGWGVGKLGGWFPSVGLLAHSPGKGGCACGRACSM
ncbi:unnamed protein product [Closterium sp. NIES-54]